MAFAFTAYRNSTGWQAVLVGGAATAIYTDGAFMSADFDVVAADDRAFEAAMFGQGFRREDGPGILRGGFYHPDFPRYGVEQVSGRLFDGLTDWTRLLHLTVKETGQIILPPIEDMIADRLGQHAVASPDDMSRLEQARALFRLASSLDRTYLLRRIHEEQGNPALLGPEFQGMAR